MFNSSKRRAALTQLEQLLMDSVWVHPGCAAELCREGLAGQRALKDSTIRTVLRHLEEKGYLTHTIEGRTFIYRASDTPRNVVADVIGLLPAKPLSLRLLDRGHCRSRRAITFLCHAPPAAPRFPDACPPNVEGHAAAAQWHRLFDTKQ